MKRALLSVAACGLLLPLTACSSGGDLDTFCAEAGDAVHGPEFPGHDYAGFPAYTVEFVELLEASDPPAEIADDWSALRDIAVAYRDVVQGADQSDPDALHTAYRTAEAEHGDQQYESEVAIDEFLADNCHQ